LTDPGDDIAATSDGGLHITAAVPVTKVNTNAVGGDVVIATKLDLGAIASKLHDRVLAARIEGLGAPIVLVPPRPGAGDEVSRPITPKALKRAKPTLFATFARVMPKDVFRLPAYGCFAAGGVLLLVFVVGAVVHKSRVRGAT
jgi:hypothetical protein